MDQLRNQLDKLTKLNYDGMKTSLYSKKVITRDQRNLIDLQVGRNKMDYLIVDVIIPSLETQFSKKYKLFLKVMEDNDDIDLQHAAEMLGRLKIN